MSDSFVTPWTVALQASLSMGFPRQEYWSGLPFPFPGNLPDPGIKPMPPESSALAGGFFTTVPHRKPLVFLQFSSVQFSHSLFMTSWTAARQASLSITNSWGLLKLISIESVMPSNHLILCHPLLLPSVFPSITFQLKFTFDSIIYFSRLLAQMVKSLPTMWETWVWSLSQEDPLEKEMATHSNILAWEIPWMEEPGGLQCLGSQRVGHDWETSLSLSLFIQVYSFLLVEHDYKSCLKIWVMSRCTSIVFSLRVINFFPVICHISLDCILYLNIMLKYSWCHLITAGNDWFQL